MERWGFRFLFCWISVFITTILSACGQLASPNTSTKATEQTPTLQVYSPPTITSPPLVRPSYTLTPLGSSALSRNTDPNTALDLEVSSPTCYESAVQSLICLGWLRNNSSEFITDISLILYLLNADGKPLDFLETTIPLSILAPNTYSPYRFIFREIPKSPWFPYAEVRHSKPLDLTDNSASIVSDLEVKDLQIVWEDTSYQVSGRVVKDKSYPLNEIRVVVVVEDQAANIVGFRVLDLSEISADEIIPFMIEVAPINQQRGKVSVIAQGYIIQR